ncbi:MAG: hypothetical protein U5K69_04105 [Balneolaceae bacterium]|nr:hypothetical protein [Balneolaceae bacterium]
MYNSKRKVRHHIDVVEKVPHDGKQVLLIKGSFPDGCTHLKSAGHYTESNTVNITVLAWRRSGYDVFTGF